MKKVVYVISILLLLTSSYMYWDMGKNQVHLQAPSASILPDLDNPKPAQAKDNPFVIRNGSNEMPKGMGQTDNNGATSQFMPQWQKDKIKDMRGDPIMGNPIGGGSGGGQGSSQPSTPPSTGPNVSQGGGVAPPTYNH